MRIIVLLQTLTLAACCTQTRGYKAPTASALVAKFTSPSRAKALRSLRATAKVDQWTRKGRIKVKVFMLATTAGKLRFEAVSPFSTTLVTLTSDGTQFASIDHKNGVYYSGPAAPCNIARVFGLSLEPQGVGRALLGGVPLIKHSKKSVSWDRCLGAEKLTLIDPKQGISQRIWMQRKGGAWRVLRSIVRDRKNRIIVRLRFERFRRIAGQWVPWVIKFEQPQRKADVIIRYQKLKVNVKIPNHAFVLPPPPGLPQRYLTCP